jgi:hypothetical protein
MAYIGRTPVVGNFVKLDAITTSATATYNLLNGGVAYFPQTANNCIVSLNGVIQSPTSAYTISGSTIVFDSALTSDDSIDFILVLGDVLSIGTPSDGTITPSKLASGTVGLISWQSVQTTGFTASAGRGYPCNTTSAAFTVTLPATPSIGDTIILLDYAGTFDTNILTLAPNGNKINGSTDNRVLNTEREAVTITYVDSTQGWLASSGVNEGTVALSPAPYSVDFLVIAGGGGGGGHFGQPGYSTGGGGAGGYRNSYLTETSGGGGSSEASLTFTQGIVYTITVGGGGAGGSGVNPNTDGTNGSNSSISGTGISTITSSGGGGGGARGANGIAGGSGGAGGGFESPGRTGGSGTANQGFAGGDTLCGPNSGSGGGGGASAVGTSTNNSLTGGNGGAGLASSISGSSVSRGGGGGGGVGSPGTTAGAGGTGGGGAGGSGTSNPGNIGTNGTVNTGGGGGGGGGGESDGGAGGKGVVILRIPTANYSGTTTGSPTVTTDGSDKVIVFNDSGSITG